MPNPVTTLFSRATSYLTPAASSDSLRPQTPAHPNNFTKAPTHSSLFPQVDPSIDGEDCNKDCSSCSIKYPWTFRIDEKDELYGQIKGWGTHILVATGRTDWVKDVTDEKGSVMEAVGKFGPEGITSGVCLYVCRRRRFIMCLFINLIRSNLISSSPSPPPPFLNSIYI